MRRDHIVLPSIVFRNRVVYFIFTLAVLTAGCLFVNFNPVGFFIEFHYVKELLGEMLLPNFNQVFTNPTIWSAVVQTLSMAFLGTLFGCSAALILAFCAASNVMPVRAVRTLVRILLSVTRATPGLVMILIFVIAVGLGAFAGILSLVFITVGTFGKLFAEIIESADHAPGEAIYSVGARRLQVLWYSIVPQVLPAFIANSLYAFDTNLRASIYLGIFGGGGIGFQLNMAIKVLRYRDATALICIIIVLVVLFEKISDYFRKKILHAGSLH
jgi:phosphonate transport system permease protein